MQDYVIDGTYTKHFTWLPIIANVDNDSKHWCKTDSVAIVNPPCSRKRKWEEAGKKEREWRKGEGKKDLQTCKR